MNKTIEITENAIQVLNVQELTDKHIVFVKVDTGALPTSKIKEHCNNVADILKLHVEPAHLVIMPAGNEVTVVEQGSITDTDDRRIFYIETDLPSEEAMKYIEKIKEELQNRG